MAERCRIIIPADMDQRMTGWPIPADVRAHMEHQLANVLGHDPVQQLGRAKLFGRALNIFAFATTSPTTPGVRYDFVFHVVWGEDEASLIVVDCGYSAFEKLMGDSE